MYHVHVQPILKPGQFHSYHTKSCQKSNINEFLGGFCVIQWNRLCSDPTPKSGFSLDPEFQESLTLGPKFSTQNERGL